MTDKDWQTVAAKLFSVGAVCVGGYFIFEYLLPVIFPLICAFFASWCVWRVAVKIHSFTGIPRGICSFFLVTLSLILLGCVVVFVFRQLFAEATRLLSGLSREDGLWQNLKRLEDIPAIYPVIKYSEEFADYVTPLISRGLELLTSYIGTVIGSIIKATPNAFLGGVVTVLFVYYASIDFDRIGKTLGAIIPKRICPRASELRKRVLKAVGGYLRAYGIIFALTFFEILAGLLVLCPQYCFIGAFCIAAVDILPVFGAGFVLIPWGVVCLLTGNIFRGVGLLVLYLAVTVVRQIIEPKIIGGSLGIHPLLTLTGIFFGYRLFGVAGMLTAPLIICVLRETVFDN